MTLFKHILVPTDGSDISDRAGNTAVALAQSTGARMTAMHVIPPYLPPMPDVATGFTYAMTEEEYERATREQSNEMLSRIKERATDCGVACDSAIVVDNSPWDAIIRTAVQRKCDAIVMASHGRKGLAGLLLGSETTKVLTHCTIPVLVTR